MGDQDDGCIAGGANSEPDNGDEMSELNILLQEIELQE
jgi:hypothetical protein